MEIWKAGKDVMTLLQRLIADNHPHLVLIEKEIGVIFRQKAIEKNGRVILGTTKKAPALLSVLTDEDYNYKFLIELGADSWQTLSDRQRLALLDHHLCAMIVTEDEEKGTQVCSLRVPDFLCYKEEIQRWGMWRPLDDDTHTALEHMFDDKLKEANRPTAATTDDLADVLNALSN
jgi:hypothetical protein